MGKKIGGNQRTKDEKYLKKILSENRQLYKYEIPVILKAFKLTVLYFLENLIEFEITDIFKFIKFNKKDSKMYIRYRQEYDLIPAHQDMKFKLNKKLKDYLNERGEFINVKHREMLPQNIRRTKNIF